MRVSRRLFTGPICGDPFFIERALDGSWLVEGVRTLRSALAAGLDGGAIACRTGRLWQSIGARTVEGTGRVLFILFLSDRGLYEPQRLYGCDARAHAAHMLCL